MIWRNNSNQYPSISSDNGLAPTRRQAIIWTNDGKFSDAYMRHPVSMSYTYLRNAMSEDVYNLLLSWQNDCE